MSGPFRWDIGRREQLGSWLNQLEDPPKLNPTAIDTLRMSAARVVATSHAADLAFIGRSPENYFDYLSGIFNGVNGAPDLKLIQFSVRFSLSDVAAIPAPAFQGLVEYFAAQSVDPATLSKSPRQRAFVDFVASGDTMKAMCAILRRMAEESGTDWNAVQRRLMLLGLVARKKNSPNTWRWHQHQDWLDSIPDAAIRNVSVEQRFIWHLANDQDKVTEPFTSERWALYQTGRSSTPSQAQLGALSRAAQLYDLGCSKQERAEFASHLAAQSEMSEPTVRKLVALIRQK